jgi:outer membrane biosynthesis protein TonB
MMVRDVNTDYAIVAEVVPISELTNIKVRSADKVASEEKESKKAPKAIEENSSKPEPKAEPKVKELDNAEKIPDKNIKDKKDLKPEAKKEAKKQDKKKRDDDFAKTILKSLEQESKKSNTKQQDKDSKSSEKAIKGDTNKEYNANLPMSISEIDGIKSQIINKWNTSTFSGSTEKAMQVIVKIELDMDGNVISARPILENNPSPYYRAFTESAVRAVKAASPIQNLSKDKYHTWKEIEFRFDSSGMIY